MEIIYPMFTLVLLTFIIVLSLGMSQVIGVKKGQLDRRYLTLFSGYDVPEGIIKLRRNFSNLLEIPVLFYTCCITLLALDIHDELMLSFAWAFVILRIIHSIIHITYNNPLHRFLAFLLSTSLMLIMWTKLIIMLN